MIFNNRKQSIFDLNPEENYFQIIVFKNRLIRVKRLNKKHFFHHKESYSKNSCFPFLKVFEFAFFEPLRTELSFRKIEFYKIHENIVLYELRLNY
jgi:hypothetical protein